MLAVPEARSSVIERRTLELPASLDVLAQVRRASDEPVFYWENPQQGTALGALGSLCEVRTQGASRFVEARRLCERLSAGLRRSDGPEDLPLFVGGFAFSDEGSADPRWRDFPALRLFVPRLLWVKRPGSAFVVISWLSGREDESRSLCERAGIDVSSGRARPAIGRPSAAQEAAEAARPGPRETNDEAMASSAAALARGAGATADCRVAMLGASVAEGGGAVPAPDAGTAMLAGEPWIGAGQGSVAALAGLDCEDRSCWTRRFDSVAALIASGAASKVVMARSRRLLLSHPLAPAELLARLRENRPMCASFWVSGGDSHLLGSSPELLVRVEGEDIRADAVAGTAARSGVAAEDRRRAEALVVSRKDLEEHALVVDAMVEAIGAVARTVERPLEPQVLSLPEAHHLRTPLSARLARPLSVLEAAALLHPTPAVCGVPTAEVGALLAETEPWRGWYTGAVGWMSEQGSGEFTVSLRSALLAPKEAWIWAGAGIVRGSRAADEFEETEGKLKAMLPVLGGGLGERAA